MLYAAFSGYWEQSHKVQFLGDQKVILILPEITSINIQIDLYSAWKEWVCIQGNARYLPALRTIGGDSIGVGQKAGDMYFLQNGWRVAIDPTSTRINGILFSDDFDTPWMDFEYNPIYPITVSSLANTVETTVPVVTGSLDSMPTAIDTANAVWSGIADNGLTYHQAMQVMLAVLAGKVKDAETGIISFRDLGDTMDRVIAEIDGKGNRTEIAINVS